MTLGPVELSIISAVWFALPFVVLFRVATALGQSPIYMLWGLLGLVGLAIGLLIMMAMPLKPQPLGTGGADGSPSSSGNLG